MVYVVLHLRHRGFEGIENHALVVRRDTYSRVSERKFSSWKLPLRKKPVATHIYVVELSREAPFCLLLDVNDGSLLLPKIATDI